MMQKYKEKEFQTILICKDFSVERWRLCTKKPDNRSDCQAFSQNMEAASLRELVGDGLLDEAFQFFAKLGIVLQ